MLQPHPAWALRVAIALMTLASAVLTAAAHADVPVGPRGPSGGLGSLLLAYALGTILTGTTLVALVSLVLHLVQPKPRRAWFLLGFYGGIGSLASALTGLLVWGGDLKPLGYLLLVVPALIGASTLVVLLRRPAKPSTGTHAGA